MASKFSIIRARSVQRSDLGGPAQRQDASLADLELQHPLRPDIERRARNCALNLLPRVRGDGHHDDRGALDDYPYEHLLDHA